MIKCFVDEIVMLELHTKFFYWMLTRFDFQKKTSEAVKMQNNFD